MPEARRRSCRIWIPISAEPADDDDEKNPKTQVCEQPRPAADRRLDIDLPRSRQKADQERNGAGAAAGVDGADQRRHK